VTNIQDSFAISGDNGIRLTISILGYENEAPQTGSDANWLQAAVQFQSSSFEVQFRVALTTHDLHRFWQDLDNMLSRRETNAVLRTEEENVDLRLAFDKVGGVRVSGQLKDDRSAKLVLQFDFASDQSFLAQTQSHLLGIKQRYPIRKPA
jgi:hypothetical protein